MKEQMNLQCKLARNRVIDFAKAIGIDDIGFVNVAGDYHTVTNPIITHTLAKLENHRNNNYNTGWEHPDIEESLFPNKWFPQVATVITVIVNYNQPENANCLADSERGRICKASWGQDYHEVLKRMLQKIAEFITGEYDQEATHKISVDTGPLLDRHWAVLAGLGNYGYNGNIIHPEYGSYVFIGSLLSSMQLAADYPVVYGQNMSLTEQLFYEKCKDCHKCIASCPSNALIRAGDINSKQCLAYLTLTKPKEDELLDPKLNLIDKQLYGCDVCQQVCPANQGTPYTRQQEFVEEDDVRYPLLEEISKMSNKLFKNKFGHTSGAWRGLKPWKRNALLIIKRDGL